MRPDRWLPAAWAVFAISLLLQILTWRALYADGAIFFIEGLKRGEPLIWPPERTLTTLFQQLPFWLALKLGVTDLEVLQAAYGTGLLLPWPLTLWLCWRLAPRHLWMPLVGCGAAYLNSAMVAAGTAHTAHALLWPALLALTLVRPLTRLAAGTLLGCSALLLYSYETQLVMGPVLALLAFWRLRGRESRPAQGVLLLSGLLLLGSAWVALQGAQSDAHAGNRQLYLDGVLGLLTRPPWTVTFTGLLVLATLALLWRPALAARLAGPRAGLLLLAPLLAWGLWPLLAPGLFRPGDQYAARALNLAVPLALLPVALLAWRRPAWFAVRRPLLRNAALALLLAQSLWHIGATVQWQGYLGALRTLLAQRSGAVQFEGSVLNRHAYGGQSLRYTTVWNLPYLTLALAPGGQVRSLLWGEHSFMPIDPRRPETIPDLTRYGYDLAAYRDALRRQQSRQP